MPTLLSHLAQFASFYKQGELLCTQGLAYLLQDPHAKSKFAAWIGRRARTKLKSNLTWRAEAYQERDGGRPDLEAPINHKPVVKVEAKLGAKLNVSQFKSYAADLQRGATASMLLVVVPRSRIDEAEKAVPKKFKANYPNVAVAVVSWEDVMDAFGKGGSQRFQGDLEQLKAMYRATSRQIQNYWFLQPPVSAANTNRKP